MSRKNGVVFTLVVKGLNLGTTRKNIALTNVSALTETKWGKTKKDERAADVTAPYVRNSSHRDLIGGSIVAQNVVKGVPV